MIALWSPNTQAEAIGLLASLWKIGTEDTRARLLAAVLAGPPLDMLASASAEDRREIVDTEIFRRLSAMTRTGVPLPQEAAARMQQLKEALGVEPDDMHAAPVRWIASGPFHSERTAEQLAQLPFASLMDRLQAAEQQPSFYEADAFASSHMSRAVAAALCAAKQDKWPSVLWQGIFSAATTRELPPSSARRLLKALRRAPDEMLAESALPGAQWLDKVRKSLGDSGAELYWSVWGRLLFVTKLAEADPSTDYLHVALNSAPGKLADIAVGAVGDVERKPGEGLQPHHAGRLAAFLDDATPVLRPGRTLVAARLNYFFSLDPGWTQAKLLPWFDFARPDAAACWTGYLWSPRISVDLFAQLKDLLIKAVANVGSLDEPAASNLGYVIAAAATDLVGAADRAFMEQTLRAADARLRTGIAQWAQTRLEEAGESAADVWRKRLQPWMSLWPLDADARDPHVSEWLARVAIETADEFPNAVAALLPFISSSEGSWLIIRSLTKHNLVARYPRAAIELVARLVDPSGQRRGPGLPEFLDAVEQAWPEARKDPRFLQLELLVR